MERGDPENHQSQASRRSTHRVPFRKRYAPIDPLVRHRLVIEMLIDLLDDVFEFGVIVPLAVLVQLEIALSLFLELLHFGTIIEGPAPIDVFEDFIYDPERMWSVRAVSQVIHLFEG